MQDDGGAAESSRATIVINSLHNETVKLISADLIVISFTNSSRCRICNAIPSTPNNETFLRLNGQRTNLSFDTNTVGSNAGSMRCA